MEPINIWRAEFEKLTGATRHPTQDRYFGYGEEIMWSGFLLAKKSMPVIELPKPTECDGFAYWHDSDLMQTLKHYGYQYTIKGE